MLIAIMARLIVRPRMTQMRCRLLSRMSHMCNVMVLIVDQTMIIGKHAEVIGATSDVAVAGGVQPVVPAEHITTVAR